MQIEKPIDEEGSEIRFFPISELPNDISPPIIPIISDLQKGFITL